MATIAGVVIGIALAFALQPGSLRSDPRDVMALTNSRLRVASFDNPIGSPPAEPAPSAGSVAPPSTFDLPALSIGSDPSKTLWSMGEAVTAVTRTTPSTQPISEPFAPTPTRAMGVLSESGGHLLTTMAAVSGIESIDIRLPDGRMVRSRIIHTMPEIHIAVLSVTDETTTGVRADIKASGLGTDGVDFETGQPVIALVETPREFVVGAPLEGVIVALDSSSPVDISDVAEGAPLVSKSGHLIGLCTHVGGRLGFVPVGLFESALEEMLNADGGGTTSLPNQ